MLALTVRALPVLGVPRLNASSMAQSEQLRVGGGTYDGKSASGEVCRNLTVDVDIGSAQMCQLREGSIPTNLEPGCENNVKITQFDPLW